MLGAFKFIGKYGLITLAILTAGAWIEWDRESLAQHWSHWVGKRPQAIDEKVDLILSKFKKNGGTSQSPDQGSSPSLVQQSKEVLQQLKILKDTQAQRQKELDSLTRTEPEN